MCERALPQSSIVTAAGGGLGLEHDTEGVAVGRIVVVQGPHSSARIVVVQGASLLAASAMGHLKKPAGARAGVGEDDRAGGDLVEDAASRACRRGGEKKRMSRR